MKFTISQISQTRIKASPIKSDGNFIKSFGLIQYKETTRLQYDMVNAPCEILGCDLATRIREIFKERRAIANLRESVNGYYINEIVDRYYMGPKSRRTEQGLIIISKKSSITEHIEMNRGSFDWRMQPKNQPKRFRSQMVIEHCHDHGWIRGITCRSCNGKMALIDAGRKPDYYRPPSVKRIIEYGGDIIPPKNYRAHRNKCPECAAKSRRKP